ncbi:unnamed protein product [Effrenium voratum]|nr:unnamed protein product [Effrenium voratum]
MEVSILEGKGLPPDALVALKVGTQRKATKIEAAPRKVDMAAGKCLVTVLQSMGGGDLTMPKGAQGDAVTTKLPVVKPDGTKTKILIQAKPAEKQNLDEKSLKLQEKANNIIQGLMSDVLEQQPADPYAFMLQKLRAVKDGGSLPSVQWEVDVRAGAITAKNT